MGLLRNQKTGGHEKAAPERKAIAGRGAYTSPSGAKGKEGGVQGKNVPCGRKRGGREKSFVWKQINPAMKEECCNSNRSNFSFLSSKTDRR